MWIPVRIHVKNDEGLNVTMTVGKKREREINSGNIKEVGQAEGDSFQWDVEADKQEVS